MLQNEQRSETRHFPFHGMIAVCESHSKLIGKVLDISARGLAFKIHNRPAVKNKQVCIRLMGPKGMKIKNISMEIGYISKTPCMSADSGQHDDLFYRMGVRLTPETEQVDGINKLIEMSNSN